MREVLLQLIGLALLENIMLMMISDEQIGKIIKLIGTAAMVSVIIAGFTEFDYHTYAASLQKEHTEIQWDADAVKENTDHLRRLYIESECEAYILDRASQMQIKLSNVSVTLEWNTEGYWYPVHAEMTVMDESAELSPLKRLVECELGIPIDEQVWRGDES